MTSHAYFQADYLYLLPNCRREDMINLGIGPNQLTLSDENCVATTNATHYLLLTEPTGCQSNISNTSSPCESSWCASLLSAWVDTELKGNFLL